jgi:two-component system, response regulator, stage 0 sporulation protein F
MDQPTPSPAILVVDDDSATLTLLKFTLRKLAPSYAIVTAEHGNGALRHLAERPIPLLVSDYLLPDMDGLQLVAAVKAISPTTYTVLASADDTLEVKRLAQEQGVDLFLSKLDLLQRLGEVVRVVLERAE